MRRAQMMRIVESNQDTTTLLLGQIHKTENSHGAALAKTQLADYADCSARTLSA
jgi:hypothetical protein